jgi:CheY-like chemotaxis protein
MSKVEVKVNALVMSRNIETVELLCNFMQQFSMHAEVCCDLLSAVRRLCHSKFEGVVVDFEDGQQALELIDRLHSMTSHQGVMVCAIVNTADEAQVAFRAGAGFILQRPLSPQLVTRTMKAAYPFMVRERRRYFRSPLQTSVWVKSSAAEFTAVSVNISQQGMAITAPSALPVGERIELRVALPGGTEPMVMTAEVCWTDASKRSGVKFVEVSTWVEKQLQSWLGQRLEEVEAEACPAAHA